MTGRRWLKNYIKKPVSSFLRNNKLCKEQPSIQKPEQDATSNGMSQKQIAQQIMKKVFAPQVPFDDIAAFDKEIQSPVKLTADQQEDITKFLQNFDLLSLADRVTIPLLVLTGEYDEINPPAEGKKVADALPNARFETILDAGYMAFFENPKRVFELIDTFLQKISDQVKS